MLVPFCGDSRRLEPEVSQSPGKSLQHLRVSPYVDHGVGVIRRSLGELATLGAVQMNELTADERPSIA
jgi:hypothetical protein